MRRNLRNVGGIMKLPWNIKILSRKKIGQNNCLLEKKTRLTPEVIYVKAKIDSKASQC